MLSKAFFRENPGFTQFLVRTVIFAAVVMGVNLFIFLYFRHTTFFYEFLRLPDFFYFDFLSGLRKRDFINAAAFSGIVFIIWNWKYLLKLKGYKQDVKQSVIFGVAAFAMLVAHYVFKFIMTGHLAFGAKYSLLMTLVKYSFNIGFVFLVFVAVFGWTFVKKQGFHFRYQIPIFIFILASYFSLSSSSIIFGGYLAIWWQALCTICFR